MLRSLGLGGKLGCANCGFGFSTGGAEFDFSPVSRTGGRLACGTVGVVLLEVVEDDDDLREVDEFLLLRDRRLAVDTGREGSRGMGVLVRDAASSLDPLVGLGEDDVDDREEGDAVLTLVKALEESGVFFHDGVLVDAKDED